MKHVILVLVLFVSSMSWSQKLAFDFRGVVENTDAGKNEAGVNVAVVQNGATLFSANTVSSGKYSLAGEIDFSQPFDIVFSKAGMVGKRVHFDLAKMNLEDIPPGAYRPVESLDMTLFKERPGVDFSFLNTQPVGSFDWNTRELQPRVDAVARDQMAKRISDLLNNAEQNAAELEKKYNEAIAAANKLYDEKSYVASRDKYEEALSLKPKEKFPSDRIVELDALIAAQNKEELVKNQEDFEYNNLITAADNLKSQDKLEAAIAKYKEALTKKDEQYPKDQIETLTATLEKRAKELENQAKYDAAIKSGDAFLKQNSLLAARDNFTQASKLKPSEQYPKDKLAEIDKKLKVEEEKNAIKQKYDDAIAAADALFTAEDFAGAKAKYEEALSVEASSAYAKGRVAICDQKLAAEKAEKERLAKIQTLLAQGNTQMGKSEWEPAKVSFTEVLTLEAGHPEATQKLALIEQKIKEAADKEAIEKKYAQLMKEGGEAEAASKLEPALAKFEEAKTVKATPEVEAKIVDLKKRIADKNSLAEKEAQYSKHMSEGESMTGVLGDFPGARAEYVKASAIFPDRQAPKDKIAEIDKLLAAQQSAKEKKDAYDAALKAADDLYAAAKYQEAKVKYQEAVAIDNLQKYPKDQILAADAKLAELAAQNEKKAKYDAAMSSANALFGETKYEDAKKKYLEASAIDAAQNLPKERIAEIDVLLANQKQAADKKAKYDAAIKEAERLLTESKLVESKAKFNEALNADNAQQYPKDKIAEIDGLLAKKAELEAKQAAIANLLKEGNQNYTAKNLEVAKGKFEEVLGIDAGNAEASAMVQKINTELASQKNQAEKDALFTALKQEGFALADAKSFDLAKQKLQEALTLKSDKEVSDKIAEIVRLKTSYDAALSEGDRLLSESKLEASKAKFNEALSIDNGQVYPKNKIAEIDALLAKKAELEGKQATIANLLKEGNENYSAKNLEAAKGKFEQVLGMDAGNAEATAMVQKINSELASQKNQAEKDALFAELKQQGLALADAKSYDQAKQKLQEALTLKADKQVSDKIAEIDRLKSEMSAAQEKDQQYNQLMTDAAAKESAGNYTAAISKYREASAVKPAEQAPKDKILALEALALNAVEQAKIDKEYRSFIDKGDELVRQEKYLEAIQEFNKALAVKPSEMEPVDKAANAEALEKAKAGDADEQYEKILKAAQAKIDSEEYTRAIELLERAIGLKDRDERPKQMLQNVNNLKKVSEEYQALMTEGNSLAASKDYAGAKSKYQLALAKKPAASEPPVKIAEMDRLISEQSSVAEIDALYRDYMDKGNVNVGTKNYQQALSQYQSALSVKLGDINATNKIKEVQQILDDLANASKANLELANKFNALIKEADGMFDSKDYLDAKVKYEEALKIDPSSSYTAFRRDECVRLASLESTVEAEREYQKIITAGDKKFTSADYEKAKDYYSRALTIKKDDPYPKKKLEEIEAILNPVVAESGELEDLGIPFNGTLEEAMKALNEAEEARIAARTNNVVRTQNEIKDDAANRTAEKTLENYKNSEEIYQHYRNLGIEFTAYDLGRLDNLEVLRAAERALAESNTIDAQAEYTTNQFDQVELENKTALIAQDVQARDQVHMTNADLMSGYNTALMDGIREEANQDYGTNIKMDQELAIVRSKVGQDANQDFEERALVAGEVVKAQQYAVEDFDGRSTEVYDGQLNNQEYLRTVQAAISVENEIDVQIPKENNVELVEVRRNIVEEEHRQGETERDHAYVMDEDIADVKRRVLSDAQDLDNNRLESNEVLKLSQKELADAQRAAFNEETEKYVRNEAIILEQVKVNEEIKVIENEAHAEKVAYVDLMDKKANIQTQEGLAGDEEERLLARQGIEQIYNSTGQYSEEQNLKLKENGVAIEDVVKTIRANDYSSGLSQTEKHQSAQDAIDKVDNRVPEKQEGANSLGSEYPEGVSEESFTKNDQNGLMTAVVTRRIVVIDGHADVYLRTQTMNGITYTKNGVPIVSHVWSKETQDPKLVRNY